MSVPEGPVELHVDNESDLLVVEAARDADDDDDNDGDSDSDTNEHIVSSVAVRRAAGPLSAPLTGRLHEFVRLNKI